MSNAPPVGFLSGINANKTSLNSRILATAILSLVFIISLLAILHIYVRCFLRHRIGGRRRTVISNFRISVVAPSVEPEADSGMDPTAIAALPVYTYRSSEKSTDHECVVCLSTLEEGEMVRLLPNCKHMFHVSCIDMWLHSHSTCPVCRTMAEPMAGAVKTSAENGEASAPPLPLPLPEQLQLQDNTLGSKEIGTSSSSRLSSSFRKILVRGFSGRREHGEGLEDLEKQ